MLLAYHKRYTEQAHTLCTNVPAHKRQGMCSVNVLYIQTSLALVSYSLHTFHKDMLQERYPPSLN